MAALIRRERETEMGAATINASPNESSIEHFLSSFLPIDFILMGSLVTMMVIAFRVGHLPMRFDLLEMTTAYWGGTALQATFFAALLALVGFPIEKNLRPFLFKYRKQKPRILIAISLFAIVYLALGLGLAMAVTASALAFVELLDRSEHISGTIIDVFIPALYLFCGVMLVFSLNHAIAGIKFAGTFDQAFDDLDRKLFGASVSTIAHWGFRNIPRWLFSMLEFGYYSLFGQIGAAILMTALCRNRSYAMTYVRSLLIGYSLALIIFYLCPSIGPFSIDTARATGYPHFLLTYTTQYTILKKAEIIWSHHLTSYSVVVNLADYYIGFPCMHVALPSIAIWFLRPWKRVAACLLILDIVLLLPSIVFLEWHYLVDVFAGFGVAASAIFLGMQAGRTQLSEA